MAGSGVEPDCEAYEALLSAGSPALWMIGLSPQASGVESSHLKPEV
jgi:hypothetical protein